MEDQIILVDEQDRETGRVGKLEAHEKGLLHRAFSIFIFRKILVDEPDGTRTFHIQLLIQQRAEGKYHSGGLWANSCCSHPRDGEELLEAAARRLPEETGYTVSDLEGGETGAEGALEGKGAFVYTGELNNGMTTQELDHVMIRWLRKDLLDKGPQPNPEEASRMEFVDVADVMQDVLKNPGKYAAWFLPALLIATDGEEYGSLNSEASRLIKY